jgi:hypothetical protein
MHRKHQIEDTILVFLVTQEMEGNNRQYEGKVKSRYTPWVALGEEKVKLLLFLSPNLCFQTGSEAHPASCTVGTGGSFPGGKTRPGRVADHSPPSSAEVKKVGAIPPLTQMCLYGA